MTCLRGVYARTRSEDALVGDQSRMARLGRTPFTHTKRLKVSSCSFMSASTHHDRSAWQHPTLQITFAAAGRVKNVASALKAVKAGPHGTPVQLVAFSTIPASHTSASLFVSCRQGRHVRHQLPRMDAGVASLQPEHPLLWYATCPYSFKTCMCAAELIVSCHTQSCRLA